MRRSDLLLMMTGGGIVLESHLRHLHLSHVDVGLLHEGLLDADAGERLLLESDVGHGLSDAHLHLREGADIGRRGVGDLALRHADAHGLLHLHAAELHRLLLRLLESAELHGHGLLLLDADGTDALRGRHDAQLSRRSDARVERGLHLVHGDELRGLLRAQHGLIQLAGNGLLEVLRQHGGAAKGKTRAELNRLLLLDQRRLLLLHERLLLLHAAELHGLSHADGAQLLLRDERGLLRRQSAHCAQLRTHGLRKTAHDGTT